MLTASRQQCGLARTDISSDFRYFCILIAAFMCMLPMDPVVPPVLNNGSGNAYFAKVATPGAASTQLTIAGNIMETQKTLAKACSSWKFTFPAMLHCVHALPRVRLPGVQVGGRRRPAWARTGAGVGPAGHTFWHGNVHFHKVFKGY